MTTPDESSLADPDAPPLISISEAERRSGVPKDTLRVWERRYGFPTPHRDASGDRVYPLAQVEKLRLIRILLDAGGRPSKLVAQDLAALEAQLSRGGPAEHPGSDWSDTALGLLKSRDVDGLHGLLVGALYAYGLERFVIDNVAPLTRAVGEAWVGGRLEVFEEHLFTELTVRVLRSALDRVSRTGGGGPRVLLTTLSGEPHALGLLMAECLMTLAGARCVALGTETPTEDVARAALAHRADVVALSFSSMFGAAPARRELKRLRAALPDATEIWAGGGCPGLSGFSLPGLVILPQLTGIADVVAASAGRHLAPPLPA